MKQNLLPAKSKRSLVQVVIVMLSLIPSACITQRQQVRPVSALSQMQLEAQKAESSSLININTATAEELERLPGVGKVVAERIVSHRQQYGTFRRAEHLMMVRGISDRKFRAIREIIVVK